MKKVIPLIAGILASISFSFAQPTGITLIDDSGRPGDTIRVFGHFVTPNPGDHTVTFSGISANILEVNGKVLSVEVPDMAFGPAKVVVQRGSFISSDYFNFTIRGISEEIIFEQTNDAFISGADIWSNALGDFDSDGDLDVVVSGINGGNEFIAIIPNNLTSGWGSPIVIDNVVYKHLKTEDLDNDGKTDIVAIGGSIFGGIFTFFNEGGTFTKVQLAFSGRSEFLVFDINYDGQRDIIYSSNFGVFILKNLGSRNFSVGTHPYPDDIDGESYVVSVAIGDINNDNYMDIFAGSERRGWLRAYVNNPLDPGESFERLVINPGDLVTWDIEVLDITGDGLNDVVSATGNNSQVSFNENLDGSTYGTLDFLYSRNVRGYRINHSDFDLDGQPDFYISARSFPPKMSLVKKVGVDYEAVQEFNIAVYNDPIFNDIYGLQDIVIGDIDNDGDDDMISGNAVYQNKQSSSNILEFTIDNQLGISIIDTDNHNVILDIATGENIDAVTPVFNTSPNSEVYSGNDLIISGVTTLDFTSPIILTVVAENGNSLDWTITLNSIIDVNEIAPKSAIPGTTVRIYGSNFDPVAQNNQVWFGATAAQVISSTSHVILVTVPDIEPGLISVKVGNAQGTSHPHKFTVINTTQTDGVFWSQRQEFPQSQYTITSIKSGDLNQDGYMDLVTSSRGDDKVIVRMGDLNGYLGNPVTLTESLRYPKKVQLADLDRDGDLDIFSYGDQDGGIFINDGSGNFSTIEYLWQAQGYGLADLIDISGDGVVDLAVTAFNRLYWFFNDGSGNFSAIPDGSIEPLRGFINFAGVDVSNDGLKDLILLSGFENSFEIYENTGSGFSGPTIVPNASKPGGIIELPYGFDVNTDGKPDLVFMSDGQFVWRDNETVTLDSNNPIFNSTFLQDYEFNDVDGDGDYDFLVVPDFSIEGVVASIREASGTTFSNNPRSVGLLTSTSGDNTLHSTDIDGDGDIDYLVNDAVVDNLIIYENQNTQNELLSFDITEQIATIIPDPISMEIVIGVPSDTDLTSIKPSFDLSFKAKAFIDNEELVSGVTTLDFSTDKMLKVVSESGDTINWSVQILPIPEESLSQLMLFVDQTTAIYTWSSAEFADSYEIEVSTDPTFASTIPGYGPATANDGENSKLILGLSAGTQYYLRIRSVNQAGVSSYSNTTQLLTLPATPQVRIDSIYQEGVDISWLSQSNVGLFRLDVSEDGFQTFIQGYSGKMINGSEVSTSIMGLEPGVEYFIRMSAQNQTGESPTSQFRQLTTVPQTPVAEEAESITPVSFEASWQSVTNGVTGYVLQVYNINGEVVFQGSYLSSQPVEITGLSSGDTYAYIVFSYNAFGFSPPSDPVEVTTIIPDPISIDVTETELFPVSSPFIEIDVDITGGWGERFVVLRYRGLSGKTFEPEIVLNSTGTDQYSAIISPSMLDDMGIYYDIATLDELGNGKISNGYTMRWSFDDELDFTIPFDNFGGSKNNWQMFSVPYELEDDLIESVFDEIGNVDYKKAWRLMSYRNQGGNGEYIDFGEGINRIEPGKGYWFNSIDRVEIKLDGGQITEEIPFVMELEPGWNQIGNPYPVPINWTTVVTQNAASGSQVGNLQVFDGSVQFQTTILYPFQGAFVWSDTGSPITIDPATTKANGKTDKYVARIENSNIDNGTWQVDLSLSTPDGKKRLGGFGMHPMASELKDDFDEMTVPRFFSYTSLSTYKPEFIYPWFTTDIVLEKEASNWDFTFESNSGDSQYDITWDNAEFAQSSAALYLLNLSSGKLINMKEETRVQVTPKNSFRILFNKNPEGIDFGNKWVIGTVYPNPAESRVTIPLIIPESSDVEVSIMDLQGKTVKVLRSGRLNEGHHELNWNLDSYSGQKVGSGVYILMLKYGEMQQTMYKRLIVK